MDKRGGLARFSAENCLSHSPKNFRRGIFYCCIQLGYRKSLDMRGGVPRFSVDFSLSHSAENFVGEHFCAVFQEVSGSQKVFGYVGGSR